MIVKINAYELETENIVNYYPCNILGEYQEQAEYTYIESKDGFKGIYLLNASELAESIRKAVWNNNDLISREALKNAINANGCRHSHYFDIFDVIDDAPAVKIATNLQPTCNNLQQIPQGDWGKWIIAEVQCLYCFNYFEVDCYSAEELNKCPHCGADMKGGAE